MTEYVTTEGTEPVKNFTHEPRTIQRIEGEEIYMMTEIGDGTFVQWSHCHSCNQTITECKHPIPVAPDYIDRWRNERFDKDFRLRSKPGHDLAGRKVTESMLDHLRELGWTLTEPSAEPDEDDLDFARDTLGPNATEEDVEALANERVAVREAETPEWKDHVDQGVGQALLATPVVDADGFEHEIKEDVSDGLDAAREAVLAARDNNNDVGF